MALFESTLAEQTTYQPTRSLLERIISAMSLHRQRRKLARLDATALADIGITLEQAQEEAARPLWDAPRHFKR